MASTALTLNDDPNELERIQEYNTDAAMARAMHEVQGAIIVAQRFKRNEDEIYQSLMKSCKRSTFAERAEYKYKRGSKKNDETGIWEDNYVQGPSVYLSREMVRLWGNIQVGTEIIRDDEDSRQIRSWAWDVQTNAKRFKEASFRKLIQRKKQVWNEKEKKMKNVYPAVTEWVRPDERDLRELTNKHGAICERNASFELMPDDFVYDARQAARATIMTEANIDPDAVRKKVLLGFGSLNVTAQDLEQYLGHPVASSSPAELTDLRQLYASIMDGQTTWKEIMDAKGAADDAGDTITGDQANEFFKAYLSAKIPVTMVTAFLYETWKVKDSRKIPADGYDKAMDWVKANAKPEGETKPAAEAKKSEPEIISPNKDAAPENATVVLDAADPIHKKIEQLFGILSVTAKQQTALLNDYKDKLGELYTMLNDQLPTD